MRPNVFCAALVAALALVACVPRPDPVVSAPPSAAPDTSAPSAVPLPLPTYPYEPGFWV